LEGRPRFDRNFQLCQPGRSYRACDSNDLRGTTISFLREPEMDIAPAAQLNNCDISIESIVSPTGMGSISASSASFQIFLSPLQIDLRYPEVCSQ
jgi:hypothetical protein